MGDETRTGRPARRPPVRAGRHPINALTESDFDRVARCIARTYFDAPPGIEMIGNQPPPFPGGRARAVEGHSRDVDRSAGHRLLCEALAFKVRAARKRVRLKRAAALKRLRASFTDCREYFPSSPEARRYEQKRVERERERHPAEPMSVAILNELQAVGLWPRPHGKPPNRSTLHEWALDYQDSRIPRRSLEAAILRIHRRIRDTDTAACQPVTQAR